MKASVSTPLPHSMDIPVPVLLASLEGTAPDMILVLRLLVRTMVVVPMSRIYIINATAVLAIMGKRISGGVYGGMVELTSKQLDNIVFL